MRPTHDLWPHDLTSLSPSPPDGPPLQLRGLGGCLWILAPSMSCLVSGTHTGVMAGGSHAQGQGLPSRGPSELGPRQIHGQRPRRWVDKAPAGFPHPCSLTGKVAHWGGGRQARVGPTLFPMRLLHPAVCRGWAGPGELLTEQTNACLVPSVWRR